MVYFTLTERSYPRRCVTPARVPRAVSPALRPGSRTSTWRTSHGSLHGHTAPRWPATAGPTPPCRLVRAAGTGGVRGPAGLMQGTADPDPKMARMRRDYMNPHAPRNAEKLKGDLTEIHNIMVQNIQASRRPRPGALVAHAGRRCVQEVLRRGEKLERAWPPDPLARWPPRRADAACVRMCLCDRSDIQEQSSSLVAGT